MFNGKEHSNNATHAMGGSNNATESSIGSDSSFESTKNADSILAIEPEHIGIVQETPLELLNGDNANEPSVARGIPDFVPMFRGSANYIANHRNTVAVYHIPGALLQNENTSLRDLMNDIAITWLLGMQIVLVAGCRTSQDPGPWLRVTDAESLRVVKEEAGYVRFELERQLARALRLQSGGATISATRNSQFYEGNVVSGNFYSAQPLGVQDGVDYKYTGFVRKVEVEKIRQVHLQRDICMLSALGVSPSGEVFNVNGEALAAATAGALNAKKVVYFTEEDMFLRHKIHNNRIQNLRLKEARNLLTYHGVTVSKKGFAETVNVTTANSRSDWDMLQKIGWCCDAIQRGVKRAHIISPKHGALLQELYTRDGSGTLISADLYEGIRQASVLDVSKIHNLITPLIQAGTLIDRPKAVLEKDVDTYYVYTRDDTIVACGQLKVFEDGFAEIGCLVVNKDFRSAGRGDAMLGYLERLCLRRGCNKVFVLSTQTMEWFVERGFHEAEVSDLPPSRQKTYNTQRRSKIYLKQVESDRDLDASELFWT